MKCAALILDPLAVTAALPPSPHPLGLLLMQLAAVVGCCHLLLSLHSDLEASLDLLASHLHLGAGVAVHLLATTFLPLHFLLRDTLAEKMKDVQLCQTECPVLQHLPCLAPPITNENQTG